MGRFYPRVTRSRRIFPIYAELLVDAAQNKVEHLPQAQLLARVDRNATSVVCRTGLSTAVAKRTAEREVKRERNPSIRVVTDRVIDPIS
jgi:hypothetical protein